MKNTFAILLAVLVVTLGCSHENSDETQRRNTTMNSQNGSSDSESSDTAKVSAAGYDVTPLAADKKAALTKGLTPTEYRVTCQSGTEAPNSGDLLNNKKTGTYTCRVCGLPLFTSHTKFRSGTGWPSFFSPYDPDHVRDIRDATHGMVRVENRCARCDAHLGHVFSDGPQPTGLRYCINSASLDFVGADEELPAKSLPKDR